MEKLSEIKSYLKGKTINEHDILQYLKEYYGDKLPDVRYNYNREQFIIRESELHFISLSAQISDDLSVIINTNDDYHRRKIYIF